MVIAITISFVLLVIFEKKYIANYFIQFHEVLDVIMFNRFDVYWPLLVMQTIMFTVTCLNNLIVLIIFVFIGGSVCLVLPLTQTKF